VVGLVGLEPTTPALSRRCSNQLSYRPVILWWRMTGSNRRPPACKAGALPAELIPRIEIHRPTNPLLATIFWMVALFVQSTDEGEYGVASATLERR
jgi:hypothetical protein